MTLLETFFKKLEFKSCFHMIVFWYVFFLKLQAPSHFLFFPWNLFPEEIGLFALAEFVAIWILLISSLWCNLKDRFVPCISCKLFFWSKSGSQIGLNWGQALHRWRCILPAGGAMPSCLFSWLAATEVSYQSPLVH